MMKIIPGGEIVLRDDRIKKEWKADILPFLLSPYPVTRELYFNLTQKSPLINSHMQHPVVNVSWLDAIAYCNLLSEQENIDSYYLISSEDEINFNENSKGYRLPSEAEWQYACTAGTKEVRYGPLDDIAWYKKNSLGSTHPVGTKMPNSWGLYDMIGNVWEWCQDVYDPQVYGPYRVFRGGGWSDEERGCLATNRRRGHPTFKIDDLGFRIARSI